jgi:Tol biopolymer transport system component
MGIFTIHPDGSSPQKRADYSTDWRWSADGARIVSSQPVQSNNGGQLTFDVTVTTLATGAKLAFPEGYNATGVTFAPSGDAVVFAGACEGHDNSLCRVDLGTGATTLLVDYAGSGRPIFAPR